MTNINEIQVTKTIVNEFLDDFIQNILDSDVVVVGSGPCGVAAAKYAAELGHKTVMRETSTAVEVCGRVAILCPKILSVLPPTRYLKNAA